MWSGSPKRKLKSIHILLTVYESSYIMDTSANPDSADANGNSIRKSGFHPCQENLILLSDTVKLNMHEVFERLGHKS